MHPRRRIELLAEPLDKHYASSLHHPLEVTYVGQQVTCP